MENPDQMTIKPIVLACILLTSLPTIAQQVYKCKSPEGAITFSSNPYCEHRQAYAKDRSEPLLTVKPAELTTTPPDKIIELYYDSIDLPDILEDIGRFAALKIEPVALEGNEIKINKVSHRWYKLFNDLALNFDLDFRKAYDRLYIYKIGTMGETIVHSPDLLRWYQSDQTWNVVLKHDDILLAMKSYENTELKERLPSLIRRVREELGEEAAVNAAETITLKKNVSAGVGSGIAAQQSNAEATRIGNAEKTRRITERRQSN